MSEPTDQLQSRLRPETIAVTAGRPQAPGAPLNQPVVLAAPFRSDGVDAPVNRYARNEGTDTVEAFEQAVGALECGEAIAFASGMAAIAAVVESQPVGTVAVVPAQAYSGTISLFEERAGAGHLTIRPVDLTDTAGVIAAIEGADLVWAESISNPLIDVADLPAIIAAARAEDALVAVDSTFTTPLGLHPLALGADISMHSATKAISGHSDLLMGVLVANDQTAARLRDRRRLGGAMPGAMECFLALRGLRTLPLRWERAQQSALTLATRLADHRAVTRVRYPGLSDDPGHAIATRDFAGYGTVLSFEVEGAATEADRVCERVRLIISATSLGGVESTIERRARYAVDARSGAPESLLRLSVGVEHVEDLWSDLDQALRGRT